MPITLTVLPDCNNVKLFAPLPIDVIKYDISSKNELIVSLNDFSVEFST
jgi:hypothetical protein